MNMSIQAGIMPQSSLLLVPLAELRLAYRRMRVAAKPIRRLVPHPNHVTKAVPPVVQAYLPAANELLVALSKIDDLTGGDSQVIGHWLTRIAKQHKEAAATAEAAIKAGSQGGHTSALNSDNYQAFAALFNSCVDAYNELVDGRNNETEALRQSGLQLYSADLGTWTRGIVVEIAAASSAEALQQACQALEQAKLEERLPDDDEQMVVQLRCINIATKAGTLVWDFFNGMLH